MNVIINKKIAYTFVSIFFVLMFANSCCFAIGPKKPYTEYGTKARNEYQNTEYMVNFFANEAFPGDNAFAKTIGGYGWQNFCVPTIALPKIPNSLRIMSYNVHNFHKICAPDRTIKKHPGYALETIRAVNPDIVALEEIVPYVHNNSEAVNHIPDGNVFVDFSMFDASMRQMDFTHNIKVNDFERHNNIAFRKNFMGKAIYTKNAVGIQTFSSSELGSLNNHDRGYVSIGFEYGGKRILLYAIHLTFYNEVATKSEVDELVEYIQRDRKDFSTDNVIIAGDFNNNPYQNPRIFEALNRSSYVLVNDAQPTAFNQNIRSGETIDLIYVSSNFLDNFEIVNQKSNITPGKWSVIIKANASDHLPVYFDFIPKRVAIDIDKPNAYTPLSIQSIYDLQRDMQFVGSLI